MMRILKWLLLGMLVLLGLLAAGALALHKWVNSNDFRQRAEREATAALGVPLKVGSLSVDVWPLPAVAADLVRLQTKPPLTLGRVEVRPAWTSLLVGRVEVSTFIVRNAVLPQQAIAGIGAALQKKQKAAGKRTKPDGDAAMIWPRKAVLDHITWVDAQGQRITVNAQAQLAGDGLLDSASFEVVEGRFAGTEGKAQREDDQWPVRIDIGGGRIAGKLKLLPGKAGTQILQGQLKTEGVEVSALTAPSKPLTGKLQAQTSLRAEFRELGGIVDALHTQTSFTVHDAVVQGIDLAQAVKTVGMSRGGSTKLETLAGQVTSRGKAVELTNLVATSGALAANGDVSMAPNGSLNGRVTVDLSGSKGTVGVPLAVGGTVDEPTVTVTKGALLGAAVGTALAPGVGTGAGAKLGDKMGESLRGLFGGGK